MNQFVRLGSEFARLRRNRLDMESKLKYCEFLFVKELISNSPYLFDKSKDYAETGKKEIW